MNKTTLITILSLMMAGALTTAAYADPPDGGGAGYGGHSVVSAGKHAGGEGGHHRWSPRHNRSEKRPTRTHVAGFPIEWHYPNPAYCIGSGCSHGLAAYYGTSGSKNRPPYGEIDPDYGYGGGNVVIPRGTVDRYRDPAPTVVVVPQPAPAAPVDSEPSVKTVRTWVPAEKETVWVPESTECGIKKQWMGDHWKYATDFKNCQKVPGRMETVVTRPGYLKEEIVKLDD